MTQLVNPYQVTIRLQSTSERNAQSTARKAVDLRYNSIEFYLPLLFKYFPPKNEEKVKADDK